MENNSNVSFNARKIDHLPMATVLFTQVEQRQKGNAHRAV